MVCIGIHSLYYPHTQYNIQTHDHSSEINFSRRASNLKYSYTTITVCINYKSTIAGSIAIKFDDWQLTVI